MERIVGVWGLMAAIAGAQMPAASVNATSTPLPERK